MADGRRGEGSEIGVGEEVKRVGGVRIRTALGV
jgi:hypothetical protein